MSTAIAGAMKSVASSNSRLAGALKDLLDFGIRLIHCFRGRQFATVSFRKKDTKRIFNLVPLWRARPWPRAFERAQLRGIRGILRDQLRNGEERSARWWIAYLSGTLHLLGGRGP
jgi:hypothetical protein